MKYLVKLILLLLAMVACNFSNAQDIMQDTIRWSSGGFDDAKSRRDITTECQFITYQNDKIEWIQSNGQLKYEMPIRKISGNWQNIQKDGVINYAIELNNVAGRMIIQRVRGALSLILIFEDWSGGPIENRYRISKVEVVK